MTHHATASAPLPRAILPHRAPTHGPVGSSHRWQLLLCRSWPCGTPPPGCRTQPRRWLCPQPRGRLGGLHYRPGGARPRREGDGRRPSRVHRSRSRGWRSSRGTGSSRPGNHGLARVAEWREEVGGATFLMVVTRRRRVSSFGVCEKGEEETKK